MLNSIGVDSDELSVDSAEATLREKFGLGSSSVAKIERNRSRLKSRDMSNS